MESRLGVVKTEEEEELQCSERDLACMLNGWLGECTEMENVDNGKG